MSSEQTSRDSVEAPARLWAKLPGMKIEATGTGVDGGRQGLHGGRVQRGDYRDRKPWRSDLRVMRKEKRKLSEAWMLVFCTLNVISASIATPFYFVLALLWCMCRSETISTGASPPAVCTRISRYRGFTLQVTVSYHTVSVPHWVSDLSSTIHSNHMTEIPWNVYPLVTLHFHWISTARISNTRPAIPTTAARSVRVLTMPLLSFSFPVPVLSLLSFFACLDRWGDLTRSRYSFSPLLVWSNLHRFSVDLYSARRLARTRMIIVQ